MKDSVQCAAPALSHVVASPALQEFGEIKGMRRLHELATANIPSPTHSAMYTILFHTWASMRSLYDYLSGDIGVCSRRGAGGFSLGSWIV